MPEWKTDKVAPQTAGMVLGGPHGGGSQQWLDMTAPLPVVVTITDPTSPQVAGLVTIAGTATPAGSPVEAAPLIAGVPGTFVAMTQGAGTLWSGAVDMIAGTGVQIRARAAEEPDQFADSAPFDVT